MSHTVHKPDYPTYITVFTQYKILKITLTVVKTRTGLALLARALLIVKPERPAGR